MGKLIVVDNDHEKFTRSQCNCDFCMETHRIVDGEWPQYQARTKLQRRMLKVIAKIEKREKKDKIEFGFKSTRTHIKCQTLTKA